MISSIDQLDLTKLYSYSDYLNWNVKERLEIIKGKIFNMSPAPNVKHQQISGDLFGKIWQITQNQKYQVFSAPFDVRLPLKNTKTNAEIITVVQPDLSIICDPEKLDTQGCLGAPDWIIEILSPGNSKKEMKDKYEVYQESGVKEYWLVDPLTEIVLVYILDENGIFRGLQPATSDDIINSQTLPDVQIDLSKLFS